MERQHKTTLGHAIFTSAIAIIFFLLFLVGMVAIFI